MKNILNISTIFMNYWKKLCFRTSPTQHGRYTLNGSSAPSLVSRATLGPLQLIFSEKTLQKYARALWELSLWRGFLNLDLLFWIFWWPLTVHGMNFVYQCACEREALSSYKEEPKLANNLVAATLRRERRYRAYVNIWGWGGGHSMRY